MTRSYKKTPVSGWSTSRSEKADKKLWHSRLRAHERDKISTENYDAIPHVHEVSNPWSMDKDGKWRFEPKEYPSLRRK